MTDFVRKAEEFATKKHMGEFDRAGVPYIEHPRFVAASLDDEKEKVVAWLHDVVEDTETTVEEIRDVFGEEVAEAVSVLTRKGGVPYLEYIRSVKGNELARKVKMADLRHNMDLSRLPNVTDADLARLEKYRKAYEILVK